MSLIIWDDSFSVGINTIDEQHKKLIAIINKLHTAMKEGQSHIILEEILRELTDYVKTHFSFEERHFAHFHYESSDLHKNQHNEFVLKISSFERQFKAGELSLSIEIMNYLMKWLTNHIKIEDKKYSKLFIEKGLK